MFKRYVTFIFVLIGTLALSGHFANAAVPVVNDESCSFVETVSVPATSEAGVKTTAVLSNGVSYKLTASGTYQFWSGKPNSIADAEWAETTDMFNASGSEWKTGWNNPTGDQFELLVNSADVNWGGGTYNPSHIYTYPVTGNGEQAVFKISDDYYEDNSGSLIVKIEKCITTEPTVLKCTDSDNGKDYYTKGICRSELNNYKAEEDICIGDILLELFPSTYNDGRGICGSEPYTCPNGCSDGACVKENIVKPDLTILDLDIRKNSAGDNKYYFWVKYKNSGGASDLPGIRFKVIDLNTNKKYETPLPVGGGSVPANLEESTLLTTMSPVDVEALAKGTIQATAYIDPDDSFDESNESNNTYTKTISVDLTSPTRNTCTNGHIVTIKENALGGSAYQSLKLDISAHPEIIRYRVKAFDGHWFVSRSDGSEWFTPGVNDVDWKTNTDGSYRRVWSYFDDHYHEYEKCITSPVSTKSLTIGKGSYPANVDNIYVAGSTGQVIGQFNIYSKQKAKINSLTFGAEYPNNGGLIIFNKIYLYDGSSKLGEAAFTDQMDKLKVNLSSNLTITANTTKTLTLKADFDCVDKTIACAVNSGQASRLTLNKDGVEAYDDSGVVYSSTEKSGEYTSNWAYLLKSYPVFQKNSLSSSVFTGSGVRDLYNFSLLADSKGEVAWHKVSFDINKSGDVTLANLSLYEKNGSQEILVSQKDYVAGKNEFYVNNTYNNYRRIPAGQTVNYILRADVAKTSNNYTVEVKPLGDTGSVTSPTTANQAGQINNFVWSDLFYGYTSSTATVTQEWFGGQMLKNFDGKQVFSDGVVTPGDKPDLTVKDIRFTKAWQNDQDYLVANVCNVGTADMSDNQNATVRGKFTSNSGFMSYSLLTAPDLEKGECVETGADYKSFADLIDSSGNISVTFQIDDYSQINESNETNNTLTKTLSVNDNIDPNQPDFIVKDINITSDKDRGVYEIVVTVKNNGGQSGTAEMGVRVRDIDTDKILETSQQNVSLTAGEEKDFGFNLESVNSNGQHNLSATVDYNNNYAESNENNNILAKLVFVDVNKLFYDWKIYDLKLNKNQYKGGEDLGFKYKIKNQGTLKYTVEYRVDMYWDNVLVGDAGYWSPDKALSLGRTGEYKSTLKGSYVTPGDHELKLVLNINGSDLNITNNTVTTILKIGGSQTNNSLSQRLAGRILLATQKRGRIYYVHPTTFNKYEVTFGNLMSLFQRLALGISKANLNQIPISPDSVNEKMDSDGDGYNDKQEVENGYDPEGPNKLGRPNYQLAKNQVGKLLLDVEDHGRIWYVAQDAKRWEVTFANAMNIFTKLSLGINNTDLDKIEETE